VRIAYRRTAARRPAGKAPALLLHGLASNMSRWTEFVARTTLAQERDVIRVDLRGHGDSSVGWDAYGADAMGPDVVALIEETTRAAGIRRRAVSDQEILERALYALVNEGARVVGDGVAQRAADVDVIYLTGYGFPAWRGGPMHYGDVAGL